MNNTIFYFFYNLAHQSQIFDHLVIFVGVYFPYVVMVLAAVFLLFHHEVISKRSPPDRMLSVIRARWKEIVMVFIVSGAAWVVGKVLKLLIHIDRPFVQFSNVHSLFPETGHTFPSGHATFFMALGVSLFFCHKKVGYVFMLFALLIGLARIIGGVHFPVDILGGFILGALIAFFGKNI